MRALGASGPTLATTSTFTIVPVAAGGKMVYWALRGYDASIPTNTELFGFGVGDEHVVSVLQVPQVQQTTSRRIGDLHWLPHGDARRRLRRFHGQLSVGQRARVGATQDDRRDAVPFLGSAGVNTLTQDYHGIISFSGMHWAANDHIAITSLSTQPVDPMANLIWMELDSGNSGMLARNRGSGLARPPPTSATTASRSSTRRPTRTRTAALASAPPISTLCPSAIAAAERRADRGRVGPQFRGVLPRILA